MKKILVICAALLMGAGVCMADNNKGKAEKKVVTTVFCTDIDCEHCKQKVLNTIPFEKGIKEVEVDVSTKRITVSYDAAKNSDEGLISAFAKIKVKAEVLERKD